MLPQDLVGLFRTIFGSYIRRLDTEVQWYYHRPLGFDFHERSPLTVKPEICGLCFCCCCCCCAFGHAGCDLISVSDLSWKPKQLCRNRRDVNGVIIGTFLLSRLVPCRLHRLLQERQDVDDLPKIKSLVASPNTSTTSNSIPRFTLLAFLSRDPLARSRVRKPMVLHSLVERNSNQFRKFTDPRGKMGQAGLASNSSIRGSVTGAKRNKELVPEVRLAFVQCTCSSLVGLHI